MFSVHRMNCEQSQPGFSELLPCLRAAKFQHSASERNSLFILRHIPKPLSISTSLQASLCKHNKTNPITASTVDLSNEGVTRRLSVSGCMTAPLDWKCVETDVLCVSTSTPSSLHVQEYKLNLILM